MVIRFLPNPDVALTFEKEIEVPGHIESRAVFSIVNLTNCSSLPLFGWFKLEFTENCHNGVLQGVVCLLARGPRVAPQIVFLGHVHPNNTPLTPHF